MTKTIDLMEEVNKADRTIVKLYMIVGILIVVLIGLVITRC